MLRKGWNAAQWAAEAGVDSSTITRGMSESFFSVTSVLSLDKLARAAGTQSILDYLRIEDSLCLPSGDVGEAILAGVLTALPADMPISSKSKAALVGIRLGLELLGRNPALRNNPDAIRAVAESAAVGLLDKSLTE